jgi:elongation factor G
MADRSASIRNIALVGHGDAGKTTFAEHALEKCGVISRAGTVQEGSTVCDYAADEKERGHSIDAVSVHMRWNDAKLQIIDTPGYPDFSGTAFAGMWACDTAALFVNGVSGPGVNTRRIWNASTRLGKARMVVVTKLDSDNADPEGAVRSIQKLCGPKCLPFNLPNGIGKAFTGVVPCFGKTTGEAPAFSDVETAQNELMEAVVEADDALLERYFGDDDISDEDLAAGLRAAVEAGTVIPILFCSATTNAGLPEVLDFMAAYAPSAAVAHGVSAKNQAGDDVDLAQPGGFAASVFKITTDVHVGKQCYLRVWRGSLPSDGMVWCSDTDGMVKIANPTRPQGKEFETPKALSEGENFCVAKVENLKMCGTVSAPDDRVIVQPPKFRKSMVEMAVTSQARGDEHKVAAALQKMADEDPSFLVYRNTETNEQIIAGRSSLHLMVVLKRLHERFHVDVETHVPRVPLKETILGNSDGHHRHKKQSGGRGQFGEVYLRIAPTERGNGFEFEDKTVGGSIPKNFMPAIEKGIREQMDKGVIAGYPVVDVRIEVYDGKHHPVDSSEAAFKMAGARAFRDAFEKAKPALLEPMMDIEIDVPSKFMGDISGDLNTRRGRISGMDAHDDHQVVQAQVPLSEIQTYSTDLRSMTSGEGMYTLTFSHLDIVPGNVAQKLISEYAKQAKDEE